MVDMTYRTSGTRCYAPQCQPLSAPRWPSLAGDAPTSRAPDPRLRGEGGGAGGTPLQQLVGIRPCHHSLMLQVVNKHQHLLMKTSEKELKLYKVNKTILCIKELYNIYLFFAPFC